MEMERAEITEQEITFRAFRVLRGVIQDEPLSDSVRESLEKAWNMPVVLVSQRSSDGDIDYRGRFDLVGFLRKIDPETLPWERFECNPLANDFG
jgi:hypothetical protein